MEKFLNKMERKIGRYAIRDLMKYICVLYCAGLVISFINPQFYYAWLCLNPPMILRGQVWRLVTFLIQPPNTSIIFFISAHCLHARTGRRKVPGRQCTHLFSCHYTERQAEFQCGENEFSKVLSLCRPSPPTRA